MIQINAITLGTMHFVNSLVKRFLKCQLMVALIAPIVMGRLPKVVVRSCRFNFKRNPIDASKWPTVDQYIVYFQNFTNTHAPVDVIRHRFEQVVNEKGVVGLSIGTRPDCLPDEVVNYLAELNERFYLWVELGLQTTFEETSAPLIALMIIKHI